MVPILHVAGTLYPLSSHTAYHRWRSITVAFTFYLVLHTGKNAFHRVVIRYFQKQREAKYFVLNLPTSLLLATALGYGGAAPFSQSTTIMFMSSTLSKALTMGCIHDLLEFPNTKRQL